MLLSGMCVGIASTSLWAKGKCYPGPGFLQVSSVSTNRCFHYYRRVLPEALDSVPASINRYSHHCNRVIEAYGAGEFIERVYKNHRQAIISKW